MLENLNTETIVAATSGGAAGATSIGWVVRILVKRLIEQNDKKHDLAGKALEKLAEAQAMAYKQLTREMASLKTDTEVIKARIGECMALSDQVHNNSKDIAVSLERIENNAEDIDKGFAGVRTRITDVLKTLNQIKS